VLSPALLKKRRGQNVEEAVQAAESFGVSGGDEK